MKRYRVIAPDLPGWGASTRVETASYGYPAQWNACISFFLLKLGRVHLIGHSWRFIASAYAGALPGRSNHAGANRAARHG